MSLTISVVIPTYNYGRFIAEAIRSVFDQTLLPSEVIVVDDGSTDNTADIVREFREVVKYVRQENAGVCAARNRGVLESTGELIAFLDADDIWEPTKLELQAAKFEADAAIGRSHLDNLHSLRKRTKPLQFAPPQRCREKELREANI